MPTATPASRLALSQLAPGTVQSEIRAMSVACEQMGGINLAPRELRQLGALCDDLRLDHARTVLDEDHYDIEQVK